MADWANNLVAMWEILWDKLIYVLLTYFGIELERKEEEAAE